MCLCNFGLFTGLSPLGAQVGINVPRAFHPPDTALYGTVLGKVIAVPFGFVMGYGSTLAAPALNDLGMKVEEINIGAFKKTLLMHAVADGPDYLCGPARPGRRSRQSGHESRGQVFFFARRRRRLAGRI